MPSKNSVSVVLGRTALSDAALSGLKIGSVIPLDRNAEETVDLLVNDKRAAKGEVVVVDGNFGIKITEMVSGE